jgi:hypothetical protein
VSTLGQSQIALLWILMFGAFAPSLAHAVTTSADTVVYSNDFESKPGSSFPEWSSSRIEYSSRFKPPGSGRLEPQVVTNVESPKGQRRFLGEFGGPKIDPKA